jgi:hypothetical protein
MFKFNIKENFNTEKTHLGSTRQYDYIENNGNVEPYDVASTNMSSLSGKYVKPYSMPPVTSSSVLSNSDCNISILFARIILIILIIFILWYIFMNNTIQNIRKIPITPDYTYDY